LRRVRRYPGFLPAVGRASKPAASSPVLSCTAWGFSCPRDHSRGGGLLPRLFTLTQILRPGRFVFCDTLRRPGLSPRSPACSTRHAAVWCPDFPRGSLPAAVRRHGVAIVYNFQESKRAATACTGGTEGIPQARRDPVRIPVIPAPIKAKTAAAIPSGRRAQRLWPACGQAPRGGTAPCGFPWRARPPRACRRP